MSVQLEVGKLPPDLLKTLLNNTPVNDPDVVLGPGIGLDCAVVETGDKLLVYSSDPITFTIENIGWYCVQINANDIATTGARPRWFLVNFLLPEHSATFETASQINTQVHKACQALNITVLGGHTEITSGLKRPLLVGTMIGEVSWEDLVTPRGAQPGDHILLTKGVPIEATALLSHDFSERLDATLTADQVRSAQNFLYNPGISVVEDARIACQAGKITAMHDPTEGGIAAALWEMAEACGSSFFINLNQISIPEISRHICELFQINPFASIASGALLITTSENDAVAVSKDLREHGIPCSDIGWIEDGPVGVWQNEKAKQEKLFRPHRDEITRIYEKRG